MCMHVSFYSHVVSFITNVYLALAWCGVDDGRDCLGALQFPLAFDFFYTVRAVPALNFFFTLIDCVTFRGLASLITFVNCLAALLCHL